jgi:hypothetical protein
MAVFLSEDDAIDFAIRKIYWDVLHRAVGDPSALINYRVMGKNEGGGSVLSAIIDSPEGQQNQKSVRDSLGLP